jgi:hypothetical protein
MRISVVITLLMLSIVGCTRSSRPKRQALPEGYYVVQSALSYAFEESSGAGAARDYFSAYLLDGGEFTDQLVVAFADYKPTVRRYTQTTTAGAAVQEKATSNRVKLWKVEIKQIHEAHATATVGWQVFRPGFPRGWDNDIIELRREGGKWIVESARHEEIP